MKYVITALLVLYALNGIGQVALTSDPLTLEATSNLNGPELPHIKSIVAECNSKVLIVVLNKSVKCFSLSNNGSDFDISPLVGSILTTSANSCVYSTDIDTVWITMSEILPPGDYTVTIKNGTDNNTLVDENSNQIPAGESVVVTILPPVSTPLDSVSPIPCSPINIQVAVPDPISCSSIAPDGSDFSISGPQVVSIIKAEGFCVNGFARMINITLASPIVIGGKYQLSLVKGMDGNSIVNVCGTETPAGGSITFMAKDTVSALFSYDIAWGCDYDTIALHYQPGAANQWQWNIDTNLTSTSTAPYLIENVFGNKSVQHIVSNGICSDTVTKNINLDNGLMAGFQSPSEICPKEPVSIVNISKGNIMSWYWDFGDGSTSTLENPAAHHYPDIWTAKSYQMKLIVKNNLGCYDTASAILKTKQSCYINVPNGFTPNGDGKNDFLYPLNASGVAGLEFKVYNRDGQLVFETRDWNHKWDGTVNGHAQATGTYVWMLSYLDNATGKKVSLQGTSTLVR